jgi:pyridoxine/pyridoxamine 5'-phosphate oxidase
MLSEIVRVTWPRGWIGIIVCAMEMPFWVDRPLA